MRTSPNSLSNDQYKNEYWLERNKWKVYVASWCMNKLPDYEHIEVEAPEIYLQQ